MNAYLVMTEVLNADGTPHDSNARATIESDDEDFWFGFEQEYFLWDPETNLPPGFPPAVSLLHKAHTIVQWAQEMPIVENYR